MSHLVPNLNLSSVHITEPFKRVPTRSSSSSSVACYTPPTLESAFDPLPRQGSSRYRRKLEEMKDGKDYLMLYRLNAEGKMLKVVRRHDFTPINLEKLARIHHNPLRLRAKVRLNETVEVSQETKQEATHRKNTLIGEGIVVKRVASSLNLLAAKRLLSTTLSLEYGSDPQKTIKPNSSINEFVEYYQHRYERHLPRPLPTLQVTPSVSLPPVHRKNSPILSLKYVKTTKKLGKLLGEIDKTRKGERLAHRKADSLGKIEKIMERKASSLWKKDILKQQESILRPPLSLPDIEARMNETQQSIQPLKHSQTQQKVQITREMQQLVRQLIHPHESDSVLSPPH